MRWYVCEEWGFIKGDKKVKKLENDPCATTFWRLGGLRGGCVVGVYKGFGKSRLIILILIVKSDGIFQRVDGLSFLIK